MEGWSPRTLLRYGFCREDTNGNIVSVWNWGELDRDLREIESDGESEMDPGDNTEGKRSGVRDVRVFEGDSQGSSAQDGTMTGLSDLGTADARGYHTCTHNESANLAQERRTSIRDP